MRFAGKVAAMGNVEGAMTRVVVGWGLAAVSMALPACEQRRSGRPRDAQYVVFLIGTREGDPIWQAVRAGANRFARETSTLRVKEVLPSSGTPMAQKVALEGIRTGNHPSAIGVLAIDARILLQPVTRFTDKGVNVVLIGDDAPQIRRRLFIGSDERAVGEAFAETLAKLCDEHRTLMVVHDNRGDHRSAVRYEGVLRGLTMNPRLKVLLDHDCQGRRAEALKFVWETSERYPNLGGWVLLGDWLSGELPADRPLTHGSAKIVSYGTHPQALRLLEAGRVDALVGVDWEDLGFRAVQACHQLLELSALPPTDYEAPPVVVTRDNLAKFRKSWRKKMPSPSSRPAGRRTPPSEPSS